MDRSDLVDISAELRHETPNAYLIHDGDRQVWVPKSLVDHDGRITFTMPEWLAIEKELI